MNILINGVETQNPLLNVTFILLTLLLSVWSISIKFSKMYLILGFFLYFFFDLIYFFLVFFLILLAKSAIQGLDHKIKHMNVISHAEGYIIKGEKNTSLASEISTSFSHLAIECFETALNSSSLNKVSLRNLASGNFSY